MACCIGDSSKELFHNINLGSQTPINPSMNPNNKHVLLFWHNRCQWNHAETTRHALHCQVFCCGEQSQRSHSLDTWNQSSSMLCWWAKAQHEHVQQQCCLKVHSKSVAWWHHQGCTEHLSWTWNSWWNSQIPAANRANSRYACFALRETGDKPPTQTNDSQF